MKNPMGLTTSEIEESRKKYGSNSIPDSKPTTFWDEFKETFGDPMIKILLVVAAVMIGMFFMGYSDIYEPIGTIIAVLLVATISAKTNVSSDSKYRQLKDSAPKPTCKVYRNGELQVIHMDDVVVGDLVLLQSGDKIPADGMLIDGKLKVNNSVLNGEAEECKKIPAGNTYKFPDEITGDTFVDDSSLFREAITYDGEGIMKVQKVGLKTMMGRMAEEIRNRSVPDSPLKVKLAKLANQISMFGYIGAAVITVLYVLYSVVMAGGPAAFMGMGLQYVIQSIMRAISLAVVIIVCAVPEGLPLMIALVLMQNTGKMMDHNVLVRKAIGIETAGSLNILFSDKTGTITKGELEVVEFFTGDGTTLTGKSLQSAADIRSMLEIAIADNTNSAFDAEHKVVGGNATDQALMRYIGENCFNRVRSKHSITDTQGFNSTNKFSQSYIGSLGRTVYKGAPEKLVSAATKYLSADGSLKPIDKQKLNRKIDAMAEKAMRVLAFGYSEQKLVQNQIHDDIVLIGLVAIRDDVRPEARDAIKEVQGAGIQICMITGDRLETAVAIAKDSGIIYTNEDYRALSSAELNQMSDDEVKLIIPKLRVVARALPTDKSRLVRLCQEMNLVTGMTGDGVNDTPALTNADVGFAMNSGTEAAKEASEIVLLDNNFRSIKDAILYGRTIYHNILKFCKFQLVINVAAVVISAIAPFFGIDEPLKVTHLLFVNLVMDGLGAIMLGNEPAMDKYMKEKPRKRDESIISKPMMTQILVMAAWLIVVSFVFLKLPFFDQFFATEEQKLTAYFALFIWSALVNGFNVRDDGFGVLDRLDQNPDFLKVFAIILLVQAAIINSGLLPYVGVIGKMFSCVPFGVSGWIVIAILALTMIPVDLVRKVVTKSH